jgi:acyl-CoA thioester hydrolase
VRVRYADTDAMGVVYHANYLAFFEVGRVEAMRQIGIDYASVVRRGLHLVVIEASVNYIKPAHFDDVLLVESRVSQIGPVRFGFDYRVTRAPGGELIASGRTRHACVDATTLGPVRLPAWLVDELHRLQ